MYTMFLLSSEGFLEGLDELDRQSEFEMVSELLMLINLQILENLYAWKYWWSSLGSLESGFFRHVSK